MGKINIGLQQHSIREAFEKDPVAAMRAVKAMGYDGMELLYWTLDKSATFYKDAMDEAGLKCFGCMGNTGTLAPENIHETIAYVKELGAPTVVIGGVNPVRLEEDPDYPAEAVEYMNWVFGHMQAAGLITGYHSHPMDSKRVGDISFYEMTMEGTPKEFAMVVDTGNTQGGGDDPLALLKKYPGRTPLLHLKGYNDKDKFQTPLWESDTDWDALLSQALDNCGTNTIIVEFGACGDQDPMERAAKSVEWLRNQLQKMGRL